MSFRLGGTDGVSIVAANWQVALDTLGFTCVTVAGEGPVDRLVPGLAIAAESAPHPDELSDALADVDLVVVENLLTIPMNLAASRALARALHRRPAVLHHHDPPWQRARFAHVDELPPDDPAWRHVAINQLTCRQLAERGIDATTIYNGFDVHAPPGDRHGTRTRLGVADDELLVAHPVRAIERKNVPRALALAEELDGTYWLLGPPEEGYGPTLEAHLAKASCRVVRHSLRVIPDIYAAADAVVFPSLWEGFGNPPVEASLYRRPVAVGSYPVADELRALGFQWFPTDDARPLRAWLAEPDRALLDHNEALVRQRLSTETMTERIAELLERANWLP